MNHHVEAQENPPIEVELARKEMADLFGVSGETIKRRTAEGQLKPVAKNSRVLLYGEKDILSMVKMGYRLDGTRAQKYQISPSLSVGKIPAHVSQEQPRLPALPDRHAELRMMLQQHRNDLVSKKIILRFAATLILDDELDRT
jgi:DNA primase